MKNYDIKPKKEKKKRASLQVRKKNVIYVTFLNQILSNRLLLTVNIR